MKTKIVEVESANLDLWGKFMVGQFDEEWQQRSVVDERTSPLMWQLGWTPDWLLVVDLSIGNGAMYTMKGVDERARYKEGTYFCPMQPAFVHWLRAEWKGKLEDLPDSLILPELGKTVWREKEHYEGVPHECLMKQTTSTPKT